MTYSKREFAKDLKAQLDLGYEPKRIGSWAHKMYLQHCGRIDTALEEIMVDLFVLEEGPEFEYPESKLRELVKLLEDESYHCRVCGLKQDFKPWGEDGKTPVFEICGCCGVDFGYQDCTPEYVKKFRNEWLKKNAKWTNPDEKPANWSLEEQIKNIPEKYR